MPNPFPTAYPSAFPTAEANELFAMITGAQPYDPSLAANDVWAVMGYGLGQVDASGGAVNWTTPPPPDSTAAVAAALSPKRKGAIDWASLIPSLVSLLTGAFFPSKGTKTCKAP